LPDSVYRLCRSKVLKNPHLIFIDLANKRQVQTSHQVTSRLLCYACEQMLARNGEDWSLRQIFRAPRFRLGDEIEKGTVIERADETTLVRLDENYRVANFIPFIMGVIWKAAVWNPKYVTLGEANTQRIREYLLGRIELPHHLAIQLYVPPPSAKHRTLLAFPNTGRTHGAFSHLFVVPGIKCVATIKHGLSTWLRKTDVRQNVVLVDGEWDDWSKKGEFFARI